MAMWDGTFDPPKKNELDLLVERELKRIDDYERQFRNSGTLAFWVDPDRWEGIDKPNLKDPGSEAFWMREPAPKAPVMDLATLALVPVPKAPERPVPPALQQYEGKWPCGCPSYHGKQYLKIQFNGQYNGDWATCSNCGAGWKRNHATGEEKLVYRLRQRFNLL